MHMIQRYLATACISLSLSTLCYAATKTVHDFGDPPGVTDGLGTSLPAGMSAKSIVELIAPGKNASLATLVGVKAWPYQANRFIAVACLASNQNEDEKGAKHNDRQPSCTNDEGEAEKEVYLAIIEKLEGQPTPTLIASYGKPLDIKINWKNSQLGEPAIESVRWEGVEAPTPSEYSWFDFAPYKISDNGIAFGIRVGWSEGYSGGWANFQALMLFVQRGNRLINIFSEPVYFSQSIAGEWHKDGTRDHVEIESENVLVVLSNKTNGYYDLQLKEKGAKWRQVFVWNDKEFRYESR